MSWIHFMCFSMTSSLVLGDGFLLLYRPRDVSSDCAFSRYLRYDLSFGMGMSDTITFVFRTMTEFDYECEVEVTTNISGVPMLVVIRFPNSIGTNCEMNHNAFTLLRKRNCLRLCDVAGDQDVTSTYYIISLRDRLRFRFISNSSINSDMNVNLYQVTVTAARYAPPAGCSLRNETICTFKERNYCFTNGVVCDGIHNCGIVDWFDERKSKCGLPVERLGYAPVVAVLAVVACSFLVAARALLRCLPPDTASFFIFNANEDNRLCIDPVFRVPETGPRSTETIKRTSIIPIFSDTSTDSQVGSKEKENTTKEVDELDAIQQDPKESKRTPSRKITLKSITQTLQKKLTGVTSQSRNTSPTNMSTHNIDI